MNDASIAHTRWNCQYHIVFIPKYRKKVIFNEVRKDLGQILRKLCEMKDVVIIAAATQPDHVHMLIYSAETERIGIYGIPEREEYTYAI